MKQGAFGFNGLDLLPDVIFRKAILLMGRSVCRISVVDIGDREFSVLWEDPFSDINMFRPKTFDSKPVFSASIFATDSLAATVPKRRLDKILQFETLTPRFIQ